MIRISLRAFSCLGIVQSFLGTYRPCPAQWEHPGLDSFHFFLVLIPVTYRSSLSLTVFEEKKKKETIVSSPQSFVLVSVVRLVCGRTNWVPFPVFVVLGCSHHVSLYCSNQTYPPTVCPVSLWGNVRHFTVNQSMQRQMPANKKSRIESEGYSRIQKKQGLHGDRKPIEVEES